MENEEINTFTRSDIISILQEELENIPDDQMSIFFVDTIIRYLDKLYDVSKFEVTVDPYIMGDFEVAGYDSGYEVRKAKMVKLEDDEDIPDDEECYWLTSFKLCYKDSNLMPRIGTLFDSYKLRNFLIHLLLEQPSLIFPNVESPEIDVMLNILADISEWDFIDEVPDDDADFE